MKMKKYIIFIFLLLLTINVYSQGKKGGGKSKIHNTVNVKKNNTTVQKAKKLKQQENRQIGKSLPITSPRNNTGRLEKAESILKHDSRENNSLKNASKHNTIGGRSYRKKEIESNDEIKNSELLPKEKRKYKIIEVNGHNFFKHPINENILFPIKNKNNVEALPEKMKDRKYIKEEFNIISFVEDSKTNQILENQFKKRNLNHSIKNVLDLKNIFIQNHQKSFVLFGHIENENFAFGKGNKIRLNISEIEIAAQESNVNVFFYGCKSSFAQKGSINSGVANNIFSTEAANQLGFAINENDSTWGLINDLASKDVKLIISEEPFGNLGFMETKLSQQRTIGVFASISGTGVIFAIILRPCEDENEDGDCDDEQIKIINKQNQSKHENQRY